jgi:hypothetical protein
MVKKKRSKHLAEARKKIQCLEASLRVAEKKKEIIAETN